MVADPLLAFHGEHQAIRVRLSTLEKSLDGVMNRRRVDDADLAGLRDVVDFLRTFVSAHLLHEESSLLPVLERKVGQYGTLVSVIAYDHDEIRRETEKFAAALTALGSKVGEPHQPELAEVNRHGIFLVQYLGLHMAKEDAYLAGSAREDLGEDGLAEVARRLEAPR